jgi:hypothetical protein
MLQIEIAKRTDGSALFQQWAAVPPGEKLHLKFEPVPVTAA